MTPRALRRARQGPPAHRLAVMSERAKKNDKVVRSLSEVGYVAKVKRMMGFRLKDPRKWMIEGAASEGVRRLEDEIEKENQRRREEAEREMQALEKDP